MFSRATSMPAPISAVICSWLEVAGPRVQTIFARRLILHPLPVVYTTLADHEPAVTPVTKSSPNRCIRYASAGYAVRQAFPGTVSQRADTLSRRTGRAAAPQIGRA